MTNKTCPSSGIQSHKNITIPCETRVEQTLRETSRLGEKRVKYGMKWYFTDMLRYHLYTCVTYCEDGDEPSRPFTQQLVQLHFGDSVHNETEDEEGRKDNAQSAAQERVKTDAFVVGHIGPAHTQKKCDFHNPFPAEGNICYLLCTLVIWFICSAVFICPLTPLSFCIRLN